MTIKRDFPLNRAVVCLPGDKTHSQVFSDFRRLAAKKALASARNPFSSFNRAISFACSLFCCLSFCTSSVGLINVKNTKGIILHSDLGSRHTSQLFERYLCKVQIRHSFSRKGNPYDNACIESFHSVLKKEEVYLHTCQDFREARRAIFESIESWYNRKRRIWR